MSDGYVKIGTKIDESGIDKGLNSISSKLKDGAKKADDYIGKIAKIGIAGTATAVALNKIVGTVNDLTDAYKAQARAETQLETASKNNPFLTSESVAQLKSYASELQSIGTIGDEEILPYMAQLANAQRTQAEIQDIVTAAMDIAASGTMDFSSAVRNLNKTFGGFGGELAEAIPEIKSLTTEELKQGGAVKLLAARYKGMAAEVARNTGTAEQLGNAFGDLKEQIGKPIEENLSTVRRLFTSIITGWTDSLSKLNEYRTALKELAKDPDNINAQLTIEKKRLADIDKDYNGIVRLASSEKKQYGIISKSLQDQILDLQKKREAQANIVDSLEKQLRVAQKQEKEEKKSAKTAIEDAEAEQTRAEYISASTDAREKAIEKINLQAAAEGKQADQQELINAYISSYISLLTESKGKVKENDKEAKDLLATIMQMASEYDQYLSMQESSTAEYQKAKDQADKLRESVKEALQAIKDIDERPQSERMKDQLDELDALYMQALESEQLSADEKVKIWEEYTDARIKLSGAIVKAEKKERLQSTIDILEDVNDFADQYANIMSSLQELVTQNIENEATVKTAELKKQYDEGAISAEEYEAKLAEIENEAAEKKYKIDMWVWSSNILSAVANTALAATKALSDGGGFLGPVLAAMITAAGGIQLATIIANKPIPPAGFATGGVIPGNSFTDDKVLIAANSAERVLTAQQNAAFERLAMGSNGGLQNNIQIINKASNDVAVTPQITEDGVRFMIDKVVSQGMADGRYNQSYRVMQNNIRGKRYTT